MALKFSKNKVALSTGFGELATPIPVPGETPEFTVGEVFTLEPNEKAWVTIDNTNPENPVISFGIPQGEDGKNGTGGTGSSFVIGGAKPATPCMWFNTVEEDEAEPDSVKYTVTYNYDENAVTIDGKVDSVVSGGELDVIIMSEPGYSIKSITATMNGITETATPALTGTPKFNCYVNTTGVVGGVQIKESIGGLVTGDVTITIVTAQ